MNAPIESPNRDYANNVKRRKPPADGHIIADHLLTGYKAAHPGGDSDDNTLKWNMFSEIVTRHAFDTAGNHFVIGDQGELFSSFDLVFKRLAQKGIVGQEAFERVLENLPSYTKGYVQTPHPTEVLSKEAIEAEQASHHALETNSDLFSGVRDFFSRGAPVAKAILSAMHRLYESIAPLGKPLAVEEEMERSLHRSVSMCDSIPIEAQALLDAAHTAGAYKHGTPLTLEQLNAFNFMLQLETWSPGDCDNKEKMTAEGIRNGVNRGKETMLLRYIRQLADIIADPQTQGVTIDPALGHPPTDQAGMEKFGVKNELRRVMWRVMRNLDWQSVEKYLQQKEFGDLSAEAVKEITQMHEIRKIDSHLPIREGMVPEALKDIVHEEAYFGIKDFLFDLAAIRETPGASFGEYRLNNRESDLSKLDTLYIQANSMGYVALRPQIRQNAEMHEGVMKQVTGLLKTRTKGGLIDESDRRKNVEKLLDNLMDEKHPEYGKAIHNSLMLELKHLEKGALEAHKHRAADKKLTDEQTRNLQFYETLKAFQLAAEHPQAITRYVIAECRDTTDILEAFFMLKAMEDDKIRHDTKRLKTEIIPLFEHKDEVEYSADIVTDAMKNRHFREHHLALTDAYDPAITVRETQKKIGSFYDPEPPPRYITVAEAKTMYNIPVKPGDDKKEVRATKVTMYAGSDITKSVGMAGVALVMRKSNELREKLLDAEVPVLHIDYFGSGGGLHRSQPVASSIETVQGRSMRQGAGSIAQKSAMTHGRHMMRAMGLTEELSPPSPTERVLRAQLNLGNLAALPYDEQTWQTQIKDRIAADIRRYRELYSDKAFAAYMGFSADIFTKKTSYAARGAARTRSEGDDIGVDVLNLRAIGYGSALNTSGSCASLYYGVTDYLRLDPQGNLPESDRMTLVNLYLNDPMTQDRVNRAINGVVMADMDAAWTYLGATRGQNAAGETIVLKRGEEFDMAALARGDTDGIRAARNVLASDPKQLTFQDKEQLAIHTLAKIDIEHARAAKGLLQLVQDTKRMTHMRKEKPRYVSTTDAGKLLEELPTALRVQIEESRKHIEPGRKFLAELFHSIASDKKVIPRVSDLPEKDASLSDKIYYAMGAMFECFENVARAYVRPRWAMAMDMQQETQSIAK